MAGLWGLLWAVYTTQFIGASFISTGLTGILRQEGAPLEALGWLQLLGLIWPLKLLWAPLLDRCSPVPVRGHYRSWLVLLQSLMILSLLGLAALGDPLSRLGPLIVLAGMFVLFSATQDIAADALSVRELSADQHDRGAGVQVSASYIGTMLGGGLALMVHDRLGWTAAAVLLALSTAVAMLPVLRFGERQRAPSVADRPHLRDLTGVLGEPGAKQWALAAVPLVASGSAAVWALVTPALTDAGWSLTAIGATTSLVASVPALGAGVLAGRAMPGLGRPRVMSAGGAIQLVGALLLMPLAVDGASRGLVTVAAVLGICLILSGYTVLNTGMYAVNLDLCRPTRAGADFTMLTSVGMLAGTVGAWAGLMIAALAGYAGALGAGTLVVLAGLLVTRRHQRQARLSRL